MKRICKKNLVNRSNYDYNEYCVNKNYYEMEYENEKPNKNVPASFSVT